MNKTCQLLIIILGVIFISPIYSYGQVFPGGYGTNLEIWLKADAGTSSTVDGTTLTFWNDQSGLSHDFVDVSSDPQYEVAEINYNPSVDFDGNDHLRDDDGELYVNGISEFSIFVVIKSDGVPADRAYFDTEPRDGSDDILSLRYDASGIIGGATQTFKTGITTSTGQAAYEGEAFMQTTNQSITTTNWTSGSSIEFRVDGRSATNTAGSALAGTITSANRVMVGDGTKTGWDGSIAEVIFYSGNLSDLEQQQVETYLALKYGITLNLDTDGDGTLLEVLTGFSEGDYVLSDGTIVWDASLTSNYHNQIISLARDDDSDLLQKQSRTIDDSLRIYLSSLAASNQSNAGTIGTDRSSIVIGNDGAELRSTNARFSEKPPGTYSRLDREWKVTNTSFNESYNLEIEWDSAGTFNLNDIRLLVDDDGDFTDATIVGSPTVTFSLGSIIVSGIDAGVIPSNSTRYITIASISPGTPLPIELMDFEAVNVNDTYVKVNWTTFSETNNAYFDIERSQNGLDWRTISEVSGANNSAVKIDYNWNDYAPLENISYYRLKQVDFDGEYTYSDIRSVQFEKDLITIYPNPGNDVIYIRSGKEIHYDLKITNAFGQIIRPVINKINASTLEIDLTPYADGIYFLQTNEQTFKLILF